MTSFNFVVSMYSFIIFSFCSAGKLTKKRRSGQQLAKPQFNFKVSETVHEETDYSELETEIECPSCQNIMTLGAYDSPYYSCNDCNMCLYT